MVGESIKRLATNGQITPKMYEALLKELDTVTSQLTKTRDQLWQTQDQLRESEEKTREHGNHIKELIYTRDKDAETMKEIRTENSKFVEEEMKMRENMDLMKKVFARTQIKLKEEQETVSLIQEERELLIKENEMLRTTSDASVSISKHEKASAMRHQRESLEKERHLMSIYDKSKEQLETTFDKLAASEKKVKQLQLQLASMKDPDEAQRQLEKQRKRIDALERQLLELEEDADDEDDTLLGRALLDEDLEDGLTRQIMSQLDFGKVSVMKYFHA